MGYTHYWEFGASIPEKSYERALQDCRRIIRNSPVPLANWDGNGKPTLRNGFNFNGPGDDGGENLRMLLEIERKDWYCKTYRCPYDIVVVACLCTLEDRLGKAFKASSDGDPHEWEDGRALAEKVLKRKINIPQDVIDQIGKYGWAARMYRKEHPEYAYTSLDVSHPNHRDENVPAYAKQALECV